MTTARDQSEGVEAERQLRRLDDPQPLGFLPTRRFWEDPENKRLATVPVVLVLWVSIFGVMVVITELLVSPVLVAVILFVAMMATVVLVHGLFERGIRRAAERRFRARLREATNAQQPATAGTPGKPPSNVPDVRIG
jgi:hypothetical protein